MGINFQTGMAMLYLDHPNIPVPLSQTEKDWVLGTDARLQVETVSKMPTPGGVRAMSEVDVTDWQLYWDWNWGVEKLYLPVIPGHQQTN